MAKMTKVLKRQISAEERIRKYFQREELEHGMRMLRRWQLVRVEQDTKVGTLVLQVVTVFDTPDGIILKVR